MSSSDESDVEPETPTDLPKKTKKMPKSLPKDTMDKQDAKKLSTKEMIMKALSESKSRKGISLYAIKKYMQDNYSVDIEKLNFLIKKNLKESVEAGTIIQTKGIGASGSFRLAPGTKQPKKPMKAPKKPIELTEKEEKTDKPKKSGSKKLEDDSKPKKKVAKISKTVKEDSKESKKSKVSSIKENPKAGSSGMKTPKKKKSKNMMKRNSIGSIIKPPRMKPSKA